MQFSDTLEKQFRLDDAHRKALKKLRLETVGDLLYHFPARYESPGGSARIAELAAGEQATLYGSLGKLKTSKAFRKKIPMAEGVLTDESGSIGVVWFHQPYIAKMFAEGVLVKAEGKVSARKGKLYLSNPRVERASALPRGLFQNSGKSGRAAHALIPVYRESRGVSSLWLWEKIRRALAALSPETIADPIPREILERYNLPPLASALVWMHAPKRAGDAEAARKRFAFEEVFLIQLKKALDRAAYEREPSFAIAPAEAALQRFVSRFDFEPTAAQNAAVEHILADIAVPPAMSRLLEGDVGSGKTFVAAVAAYATVTTNPKGQDFGNLQVAYMAPTEILATQLFESFISFFTGLPIQIGLITSSGCRKFPSKVSPDTWTDISRTQLLKWVANGEIPILIGTHALIQKTVKFKHLALVIIDEQHRFGTNQRAQLAKKDTDQELPHLLSMTATPIPRTLALTIYGDLDLTLLDQMPRGRKPVETTVVPPAKRSAVYKTIQTEVAAGRQAYVVCPRIDEPDPDNALAVQAKSARAEAARLQKEVFPALNVGLLHGKMTPKEKDTTMREFAEGVIDVLVATSVVEVGVNVPNATTIVIEGAERFGLAQLHQLRGRVLRSEHQARCFLFTESTSANTRERLRALATAKNGFELAERDLQFRGAGQLYGGKQWGISDIGMDAIRNLKMVEVARAEARALVEADPALEHHPFLKSQALLRSDIHFE